MRALNSQIKEQHPAKRNWKGTFFIPQRGKKTTVTLQVLFFPADTTFGNFLS